MCLLRRANVTRVHRRLQHDVMGWKRYPITDPFWRDRWIDLLHYVALMISLLLASTSCGTNSRIVGVETPWSSCDATVMVFTTSETTEVTKGQWITNDKQRFWLCYCIRFQALLSINICSPIEPLHMCHVVTKQIWLIASHECWLSGLQPISCFWNDNKFRRLSMNLDPSCGWLTGYASYVVVFTKWQTLCWRQIEIHFCKIFIFSFQFHWRLFCWRIQWQ